MRAKPYLQYRVHDWPDRGAAVGLYPQREARKVTSLSPFKQGPVERLCGRFPAIASRPRRTGASADVHARASPTF